MELFLDGHPETCPDATAGEALLATLRDHFGRNGPRLGCGAGFCGACTVLLDGRPVRSCVVPTSAAASRRLRTLDGLAREAPDHPVLVAWARARVPQCGYCQNGQIMTVVALHDQSRLGDAGAVEGALDGVLCRCGTQPRIRRVLDELAAAEGRRETDA
jgi:aerobic-type carbon monoxide dehydrogenase small subunit (CoxS/CutS family)